MPIKFPQQSSLVDDTTAFISGGVIRGRLLKSRLVFLFGHGKREKGERREYMGE